MPIMGLWDRITSQFIEIIEFLDDTHDTLLWRFPVRGQEIKNGAKLVVREGQSAIFVNEGKLADVFGPGTYTLTTQNLPILATLKGWKYGFNSPFKAEVYFVNTTQVTDLKWGTQNPIMMRDPEFGPIRLRAFGMFTLQVTDPTNFLRQVAGTDSNFEVDEIVGFLKRTLVSRFTQALGSASIPALDLAGNYEQISAKVMPFLEKDFDEMGLRIGRFVIENVSLPKSVEKVLDKRTEMGIIGNMQQFAQYQMASAIPDAATTQNSMAGAGMGLAAGFNMANQMTGMMPQQAQAPAWGHPTPHPAAGHSAGASQPGSHGAPAGAGAPGAAPRAPAAGGAPSMVDRLKKLDALKAAGVLSEEEYTQKRQQILAEI
jgi:membrane protease subunit (stomatin/prohibitin family)